ncbi:hypothetical protein GNZ25_05515 [Burkholderia thailandensis]|uniref:hypothetical protein n=1 Tax=Burkholderia thailandensis TaxID=57975 RepID=UPI0012E75900|nr:hypothetical protein [Burkholderia thailandensis]MUV20865.1 hypothetical protein [Burkholderia thailandensis]
MGIERPLQDLEDARAHLQEMRDAPTFPAFDRAWVSVLADLSRAWHRTQSCVKPHPEVKAHKTMRDALALIGDGGDDLLVYLRMARNAREHGLVDITRHEPGSLAINPPKGATGLYIRHLEFKTGRVMLDAPMGAEVLFRPGRVIPATFIAFGKEYYPPLYHLGKPVDGFDAIALAEAGIAYYDVVIREVGQLLAAVEIA